MKITLISETPRDEEVLGQKEKTYKDVREFFLFTKSSTLEESNVWNGSYRYLIGSLYYYLNKLKGEEHGDIS